MFGRRQRWAGLVAGLAATFGIAAAAPADTAQHAASGGGAFAAVQPDIRAVECETGESWRCAAGQSLRLEGQGLQGVKKVRFAGGTAARPRRATVFSVVVRVPRKAETGAVRVVGDDGAAATPRPVEVLPPPPPQEVFPIDGPHDMGQSETNRFGGGRGHQGQDLFAECGTPLVSARDGKVTRVEYHGAAGNYVVIQDRSREAVAYMHLRDAALVAEGDRVQAGDRIGFVGDTGRATGCHLHIELWTAPGYYTGGHPIDPLPWLEDLEADHHHGKQRQQRRR